MEIRKYIIYISIAIILLVICVKIGLNTDTSHNFFSNNHWNQEKKQLQNIELSMITFYTGGSNAKKVELTGAEKDKRTKPL